jgi:cytoskeletal protein CcmA (bactofilin family)
MARKTDVFNVSNIDTVISSGVRLKGNLVSDGDVAVDGTLVGNINSGGHVAIGVNARIAGNIKAISIQIAGEVEGDLVAADSVSLIETAQLRGNIDTTQFEVAMGAIFIGTSKMKPAEAREVQAPESAEA